ncbi:helix-turn-helix transcriptional regulator [Pseudomonas aeruginosa]|uniref:helix-turn-helix transcriptional regulator n=1 Tax=Pseudomonas aeruginosa TaxID=287 RepID=UPI00301BDF14
MALVDGFLELERSSGKLEWSAILQKMASDLGFSKILFGLLPKDSQAGLVYGLTMPLHGARGELGALSLSVEAENRAEANRFMESVLPTLWMLKDYALQSGAGLAFEHPVSKPVVLTSREKEVLQWCAIGKTSWEISVICNCSEANVNFHMGNIRRKFGVTSRRVAAIMAVNLGLITL